MSERRNTFGRGERTSSTSGPSPLAIGKIIADRTEFSIQEERNRRLEEAKKRKDKLRVIRVKYRGSEANRDEVNELQAIPVPDHDPNPGKHFTPLPEEVYKSHRQLEEIARVLNSPFGPVEVVFIGQRGHGKSALIEALSGHVLSHVTLSLEGTTKRPIHYQFVNNADILPGGAKNSEGSGIKCVIQYDALFKDHNLEVPLSSLSKEIARRSVVLTAEPIYITIYSPNALNRTFIDTPGLPSPNSDVSPDVRNQLESIVASVACEESNRFLLFVEEAVPWEESCILPLAQSIDPAFNRSALVFTKFNSFLRSMLGTKELINRYLKGGKHPLLPCFWVTVPSHKVRGACADSAAWQEKVWQCHHRDLSHLRGIKAKQKYEPCIGILSLLRFLLKHIWKQYIDTLPSILKLIRQQEKNLELEQNRFQNELDRLNAHGMRSLASKHIASLFFSIHRIVHGTSEAITDISGQTLEEETLAQGFIEWVDRSGKVLKPDPKWNIPFRGCKLYGGQQMDRLLAEFRVIADHLYLRNHIITTEDLATSGGMRRLHNGHIDITWAASALAGKKTRDTLEPLINVALQRMAFIIRRSFYIAVDQLNNPSSVEGAEFNRAHADAAQAAGLEWKEVESIGYPFFAQWIEDLFEQFLTINLQRCKEKCLEEFYSTETIYWGYNDIDIMPDDDDDENTVLDKTLTLTRTIFEETKDRQTRNLLLKIFQHFLFILEVGLKDHLQKVVSTMDEPTLESKFQVESLRKKLEAKVKVVADGIKECRKREYIFTTASAEFSVPILTEMQMP